MNLLAPAVPRARLSRAAFAAVTGAQAGAEVVDPALAAAVEAWETAAVGLHAALVDGPLVVRVDAAVAPPVAVCVASATRNGAPLDAVELSLPGVPGLVAEVLGQLDDGAERPHAQLWLRVRGPLGCWVARCGARVPAPLRRDLTAALVEALTEVRTCR